MAFDFESEKLIKELKKRKPKRVLVQLPEGVKQNAFDILKIFQELEIEVVFSGETCWGGCSIGVDEAKAVGADLIVHFGHSEFMKTNFPVIYIPIKDELDLIPLLRSSMKELANFKRIGIGFSIQHLHDAKKVADFYKRNGKEVFFSKKGGNIANEGQIIGCQYGGLKEIEGKVDCFLIVGNKFHSLGAALAVNKPVFLMDVYNDEVGSMSEIKDRVLKQRIISVERFKRADKIGLIVSSKKGQNFFGGYKVLRRKFEKAGKKTLLITMNELAPDKLMNFYSVEGFVEMVCPRIAVDDFAKYSKPIITFKEALVALGEKSWGELIKEGLL